MPLVINSLGGGRTLTRMHTCTCTHTHTHMHAHARAHTHTHTPGLHLGGQEGALAPLNCHAMCLHTHLQHYPLTLIKHYFAPLRSFPR